MQFRKNIAFIFQFATIGLALAFVVVYLYPNILSRQQTVQLKQSDGQIQRISPADGVLSYAEAVKKAAPTVVNVYATKLVTERRSPFFDDPLFRHFFGGDDHPTRQHRESSLGSGVILSEKGYVLTNNHVIADAAEIAIALHDGRTTSAKLFGADPESDLAVLKIELEDLPVVTLGRSDNLQVGDVVLAIGNPFGVGQTVTSGIISGLGRSSLGINTFENFIQTDAAINPGNSGGALVNTKGELIGINTAIYSQSGGSHGIGFAIPVNLARDVLTQLIEHGHVIRGWLGIKIQDITPKLASAFELDSTDGVVITNIVINGPADKAGLDRGDIITHINGKKVHDYHETLNEISKKQPGTEITLTVIHEGKKIEKMAVVTERPTQ
ncbi:MAG: Do family serine endopeptidase [Thioalkalispiraceae bacterium]|jgi:serine protease DegS